jgi:tRNA (mo5U34)-methyltransferase
MDQSKSIKNQIDSIKWFHTFDTETFGFSTKGKKLPNKDEIQKWGFFPNMFKNKTVLDIGAWDGYNSFYAEKAGARRVLAIDNPCWSGNSWGTKEGFDLAHKLIQSRVESLDINLYNITPEKIGTFEVVLMLGVLYHLTDPFDGLKKAASVTKDLLIIETTFENLTKDGPFFAHKPAALVHDSTNHYSPNIMRIPELLKQYGFNKVYVKRWCKNRIICYAYKPSLTV